MELLVHINKRIKNNPRIQLPVEALLLQYQDPAATSFVINFTIIYIKMGFPRLPLTRQIELVPSVLAGIEAKPTMHQVKSPKIYRYRYLKEEFQSTGTGTI
jgi:proteasome component ECM29